MLMKSENTSQRVFPLAMASEGERVKIVSVQRGKNLAKRLIAMGIIEETELHILQRQPGQGLVVVCGETRMALGAGMANKIMVTPIQRNLNDVF
jgi:ferrous iron transport protein A